MKGLERDHETSEAAWSDALADACDAAQSNNETASLLSSVIRNFSPAPRRKIARAAQKWQRLLMVWLGARYLAIKSLRACVIRRARQVHFFAERERGRSMLSREWCDRNDMLCSRIVSPGNGVTVSRELYGLPESRAERGASSWCLTGWLSRAASPLAAGPFHLRWRRRLRDAYACDCMSPVSASPGCRNFSPCEWLVNWALSRVTPAPGQKVVWKLLFPSIEPLINS